jgi:excisionase family DNA binding protein
MDSTLSRLLLDYEEAGDALNVGRTTIYKLVAAGEITPVKIGKRSLVTADSVRAYVNRLASEGTPDAAA